MITQLAPQGFHCAWCNKKYMNERSLYAHRKKCPKKPQEPTPAPSARGTSSEVGSEGMPERTVKILARKTPREDKPPGSPPAIELVQQGYELGHDGLVIT